MYQRLFLTALIYYAVSRIPASVQAEFVPKAGGSLIIPQISPERSIKPLELDIAIIPRGGSLSSIEKDGNVLVRKVRNTIRSILKVSEKKAPILASILTSLFATIEGVTGINLLPSKKEESKKPKSKKSISESKKPKNKEVKKKFSQQSSKSKADKVSESKERSKVNPQAQSHLTKDLKTSNPNYRIQRELKEFLKAPPPNLSVKVGKNIRVWIITMVGTKGSLYEGETYRLRVQFPANYPTEPPSVYFLQPTPRHEHVYTNGDICLSLLGKDWRPNMTAQSIAMSILSILSGAQRKSLPMDNAAHAQNKPGEKQDNWVYHDDNC